MSDTREEKQKELAALKEQISDLKKTFPEHCYGTKGYIGVHRATPEHYQKYEDLEEQIEKLTKELEG